MTRPTSGVSTTRAKKRSYKEKMFAVETGTSALKASAEKVATAVANKQKPELRVDCTDFQGFPTCCEWVSDEFVPEDNIIFENWLMKNTINDRNHHIVNNNFQRSACLNVDEFNPSQNAEVAIVTGVFGPLYQAEFAEGVLKIARQLKVEGILNKTKPDLVVMEIDQFPIREPVRQQLKDGGWNICSVACVMNKKHFHQPQHKHRFSFTKIKAWALGYYPKILWFDADLHIVGNLDELLNFPLKEVYGRDDCHVAAVRDVVLDTQVRKPIGIEHRHFFNAGLMVLEPSLTTYRKLLVELGPQAGRYNIPNIRNTYWRFYGHEKAKTPQLLVVKIKKKNHRLLTSEEDTHFQSSIWDAVTKMRSTIKIKKSIGSAYPSVDDGGIIEDPVVTRFLKDPTSSEQGSGGA